jgi:hypothetical protein
MATVLQHKRSDSAGQAPTTSTLALGEIAINTADGHLYIKKNVGGVESIVKFTSSGVTASDAAITLDTFTGDGTTRVFDTGAIITGDQFAFVTINGVTQQADAYDVFNNQVTFAAAPDAGDSIEIRVLTIESTEVVLRDNFKFFYTVSSTTGALTGADANGNTLAYDIGQIDVFQNGVKLAEGYDYTATDGSTVSFTTSLESGDIVEIVSHSKASYVDSDSLKQNSVSLTTTTPSQLVDYFSGFAYRSAKYIVQATSGSAYQVTEVMLIHDGTDVFMSEYGTILTTGQNLMTLDADITNGNIRLLATPLLANTTIKVQRITVTV